MSCVVNRLFHLPLTVRFQYQPVATAVATRCIGRSKRRGVGLLSPAAARLSIAQSLGPLSHARVRHCSQTHFSQSFAAYRARQVETGSCGAVEFATITLVLVCFARANHFGAWKYYSHTRRDVNLLETWQGVREERATAWEQATEKVPLAYGYPRLIQEAFLSGQSKQCRVEGCADSVRCTVEELVWACDAD